MLFCLKTPPYPTRFPPDTHLLILCVYLYLRYTCNYLLVHHVCSLKLKIVCMYAGKFVCKYIMSRQRLKGNWFGDDGWMDGWFAGCLDKVI